jgi:hypothetical protein
MSYRDVSESLRAYRDRVAADLEEARRAARDAAQRASKVSVLERELAETDGLLDKMGGRRRALPMLEDVRIAAPCTASWDDMVGDEHVRFCGQCEKNVYNLSSLPREEAEALLAAKEGKACVRLYRREDGTVLTADCPVGVTRRRRRRAAFGAVGAGLMAAAGALGLGSQQRESVTMGGAVPTTPTVMGTVAPDQGQPVQVTPVPTVMGHTMGAVAIPIQGKPKVDPKAPKPGQKAEPNFIQGEIGF